MKTPADRNINFYIDLKWEDDKPRIYVAGKPFLYCSFLVVNVVKDDPRNETATVEDLAERPGARVLEGHDAVGYTDDEGHVLTADDVMFGFASSLEGWVRHGYKTECLHVNLSFPLLKELARAGDAKAKRVLQAELIERLNADHENTSLVILETCADVMDATAWRVASSSSHAQVRQSVANYTYTPATVLAMLAKHTDVYVRRNVATNTSTPPTTLALLATDTDDHVRVDVSFNTNTPAAALAMLAKDTVAGVRRLVANNTSTPAAALALLAKDTDVSIRMNVARNTSTRATTLAMLAKDTDAPVRQLVASNTSSPDTILSMLATDTDAGVRRAVALNKNARN